MVKSVTPSEARAGKIEITPGQAARSKSSDPETFWSNYYRTHKGDPEELRTTVGLLNASKQFRQVQAALTGFLRHHGKDAEPWMYSGLALAIKMNKGPEADQKRALGYAADLAKRGKNPNDLVSVADQMLLLNQYEEAGPLLDLAAEVVPHRGEPLLMAMNLAQKTRDPKRMADAVDRLLSLGWPGDPTFDETVRRDARKSVETLAKTLKEEGRDQDAEALLEKLGSSEARDLYIRLTWLGDADLDLAVEEPLGATARVSLPRTVFGGAIIKNGYGNHPEEVYVCPRAYNGTYTITIDTIYNNEKKPALAATLEIITHEGTPEEKKITKTVTLGGKSQPVTVELSGGRRTKPLPYIAPRPAIAPEIVDAARKQAARNAEAAKARGTAQPPAPRPAGEGTSAPGTRPRRP
ncbi:MAG: hypothetical protein U0794_09250 [Isosphaeraceae bacterium]